MRQIIEIGFEINSKLEFELLECAIISLSIPYYIEPQGKFNSLEDLECQCEGK